MIHTAQSSGTMAFGSRRRVPISLIVLLSLCISRSSFSFQPVAAQPSRSALAASTAAPPAHHLEWLEGPLFANAREPSTPNAYQQRKEEWARRYTDVNALRATFGKNQNTVWGDLDPATTRRLYKTLLPRALLELYNLGVQPEDLAPLAFRARVAAKLYARERSELPTRVAASLYDGFRQWRKYGSFNTAGMTYQQVWEKYAAMILEECQGEEGLTPEDVTARICLKILERSCATNEMVDKMVLRNCSPEDRKDLREITEKLEADVRNLLDGGEREASSSQHLSAQRIKTLKTLARIKRRLDFWDKKKPRQSSSVPARQSKAHQQRTPIWKNRERDP